MKREDLVEGATRKSRKWDFVIIGGGATGLGAGVEAASRRYRTLLLEQSDFAKGTSSRSTKLIHGGIRYLRQGNLSLVLEALRERGLLLRNAPHLVHNLSFVVPTYDWWEGPFYGVGLKLYDMLAGKMGLGPSRSLSREETLRRIPTLEPAGLRGGVIYHDGQFDDSRLAINLTQTLLDHGGAALNYVQVTSLLKSAGTVCGVVARDLESGQSHVFEAKAVINATGVFSDAIRRMDDPQSSSLVAPSQGVHLVLDQSFMPGDSAVMVPQTDDGRVLFAVPWHNRVVVGTTDTPVEQVSLEPRPLKQETEFLLSHAARYLTKDPSERDVLSVFAGLRPLVSPGKDGPTASVSRDHSLVISSTGLVTVVGGKWTTYRKMGEDTIDQAALIADLDERPSRTAQLPIHGWCQEGRAGWANYGSDARQILDLLLGDPSLAECLHPRLPYTAAEVVWAVRSELARTVEDVLARRTRALLLDARSSMDIAPKVARLMAEELGRDQQWQDLQISGYCELARGYLLDDGDP